MLFKASNFITIPGFAIVELQLSGNELICYSLIYGFTQDGDTEFSGSLSYVSSALHVTKQNAKRIIDRLIDRGLLEKRVYEINRVKYCHYIAIIPGIAETATGGIAEIATGGVAKTATNNSIRDKANFDSGSSSARENNGQMSLFGIDAKDGERESSAKEKTRGTSDVRECLFENSRWYDHDKFIQRMEQEEAYAGADLEFYYERIKNWSASRGAKRKDWIATARNFMQGDFQDGKLVKRRSTGELPPDMVAELEADHAFWEKVHQFDKK